MEKGPFKLIVFCSLEMVSRVCALKIRQRRIRALFAPVGQLSDEPLIQALGSGSR
ncbi:hypothetical protein [Litoreibacter roseus]|uniref:Uncharacterized protein n=1 Tax=Litoreibacter roseus TaxID=2601869 RepID=A0A6N6JDC9_9RHOB|nr:hypothetical protein [Litoreibacter roseus]GFE63987.1 hypothetical protein KIN_10610 [Litoreibacter roseus]